MFTSIVLAFYALFFLSLSFTIYLYIRLLVAVKKGKAISGVKTQNLDEGDKVASIAVIPGAEIEEEVE